MVRELHVDMYPIDHNAALGEPFVRPGTMPTQATPSRMGMEIEAESPGSYWPHNNGYSYETHPHENGDCETHRPKGVVVRFATLSELRKARGLPLTENLHTEDPAVSICYKIIESGDRLDGGCMTLHLDLTENELNFLRSLRES